MKPMPGDLGRTLNPNLWTQSMCHHWLSSYHKAHWETRHSTSWYFFFFLIVHAVKCNITHQKYTCSHLHAVMPSSRKLCIFMFSVCVFMDMHIMMVPSLTLSQEKCCCGLCVFSNTCPSTDIYHFQSMRSHNTVKA